MLSGEFFRAQRRQHEGVAVADRPRHALPRQPTAVLDTRVESKGDQGLAEFLGLAGVGGPVQREPDGPRRQARERVEQDRDALVRSQGAEIEQPQRERGVLARRSRRRGVDVRCGIREQPAARPREAAAHVELQVVVAREEQALERRESATHARVACGEERAPAQRAALAAARAAGTRARRTATPAPSPRSRMFFGHTPPAVVERGDGGGARSPGAPRKPRRDPVQVVEVDELGAEVAEQRVEDALEFAHAEEFVSRAPAAARGERDAGHGGRRLRRGLGPVGGEIGPMRREPMYGVAARGQALHLAPGDPLGASLALGRQKIRDEEQPQPLRLAHRRLQRHSRRASLSASQPRTAQRGSAKRSLLASTAPRWLVQALRKPASRTSTAVSRVKCSGAPWG